MVTDLFLSWLLSSINSRVFCDVASSQLIRPSTHGSFGTVFFLYLQVPSILIRRIVDCFLLKMETGIVLDWS